MKIVIDTSPLISLAVLDHLELLKKLFSTIIVPHAVYQEIKAAGEKEEYIRIANFIENHIYSPKEEKIFHHKLGKDETEAIILCLELKADLLILDDKKARTVAESHDIKCIGTLGMLTLARQKGIYKRIKKVLYPIA